MTEINDRLDDAPLEAGSEARKNDAGHPTKLFHFGNPRRNPEEESYHAAASMLAWQIGRNLAIGVPLPDQVEEFFINLEAGLNLYSYSLFPSIHRPFPAPQQEAVIEKRKEAFIWQLSERINEAHPNGPHLRSFIAGIFDLKWPLDSESSNLFQQRKAGIMLVLNENPENEGLFFEREGRWRSNENDDRDTAAFSRAQLIFNPVDPDPHNLLTDHIDTQPFNRDQLLAPVAEEVRRRLREADSEIDRRLANIGAIDLADLLEPEEYWPQGVPDAEGRKLEQEQLSAEEPDPETEVARQPVPATASELQRHSPRVVGRMLNRTALAAAAALGIAVFSSGTEEERQLPSFSSSAYAASAGVPEDPQDAGVSPVSPRRPKDEQEEASSKKSKRPKRIKKLLGKILMLDEPSVQAEQPEVLDPTFELTLKMKEVPFGLNKDKVKERLSKDYGVEDIQIVFNWDLTAYRVELVYKDQKFVGHIPRDNNRPGMKTIFTKVD